MKRVRQPRRLAVAGGSFRNCRHLATMMTWISSTALVQTPALRAPVQTLEKNPMVATSSRTTGEAESRFCAKWRSNS
jgi:hypothetical protein